MAHDKVELSNNYERLSAAGREHLFRNKLMLIGGKFVAARSGKVIAVEDPTNLVEVGTAPAADLFDVDAAVVAARQALDHGPWGRMTPGERERLMLKLADLIERDRQIFAEIEAVESGRTLMNTQAFDSDLAVGCFRYMAGWTTKLSGKTLDLTVPYAPNMRFFAYTTLRPIGVVAAVTPWNVPLCQAAWKIAPALAAGCTIILKPSELTPLGAIKLAELVLEAGFPDGVVNIVTGTGPAAGAALVSHPLVDKVSFTGSNATGLEIAKSCAVNMKKVTLELGGKSPVVVLQDADLELVIPGAAGAVYGNHGQNCCAGSRLYAHRSVFDKVVAGIKRIADQTILGSGLDPATQMGPLASKGQQKKVLDFVEHGVRDGAELAAGGKPLDHIGAYVRPSLLTNVRQDMAIVREEIFGPVLVATPFDDDEDALRLANDTSFGLAASVWTRDLKKAHHFSNKLNAGTVWVNTHNILDAAMPFGGMKNSGMGHDLGEEAVLQNSRVKASVINLT